MHFLSKLALSASLSCLAHVAMATATSPGDSDIEHPIDGPSVRPPVQLEGNTTYTYARCWYQPSSTPTKSPKATYKWAVDDKGAYVKVTGYWWKRNVFQWRNLFYTNMTKSELKTYCEKTLARNGIDRPVLDIHAADTVESFNYTIWSNVNNTAPIDRIVVFGDSLSDTSNIFNAALWQFPNPDSWALGRFSNGRVWVEYLGEKLNLPVYNWAVGGAASDQHYIALPGMRQQVDSWLDYMDKVPSFQADRVLYTIWVGGNDIVNYTQSVGEYKRILIEQIKRIYNKGGRQIVLLNLPDLSKIPAASTPDKKHDFGTKTIAFNAAIAEIAHDASSAGIPVQLIDVHAHFNDILSNPAAYGFDQVTQSCLNLSGDSATNYLTRHSLRPGCTNPDTYMFWDMIHPTTKTHRVISEKVAEDLSKRLGTLLPVTAEAAK